MKTEIRELLRSITMSNKLYKRYSVDFDYFYKKLIDYRSKIMREEKLIGNKEHFLKAKLENELLSAIEYDEEILLVQDKDSKFNLAMLAAMCGMEKVVIKGLENPKVAIQRDCYYKNLGMHAAISNLHDATMLALDNPIASIQQDDFGANIGIIAAYQGMEDCVLKALDNKQASFQKDEYDKTMGFISAEKDLALATLKTVQKYPEQIFDRNDMCGGSIDTFVDNSIRNNVNIGINLHTKEIINSLQSEKEL